MLTKANIHLHWVNMAIMVVFVVVFIIVVHTGCRSKNRKELNISVTIQYRILIISLVGQALSHMLD